MSDERDQNGAAHGPRTRRIITPIMLTAVGTGALLSAQNVVPVVDWAWVLGLAVLGGLVLFLEGVNKFSVVVGPALIVGAILSVLRQTGYCGVETEMPLLTITVGGLWTLTHIVPLPNPAWFLAREREAGCRASQ